MIKTAVLLVGGKSLRLRPYTDDIPKCMVDVGGKPLIEWIFDWLKENGIETAVLSVDYKKEVLIDHVGRDQAIPMAAVEQIRAAVPDGAFYVYPGAGHGFSCTDRASYSPADAELAFERSRAFLESELA